jgi:hypothetical protein
METVCGAKPPFVDIIISIYQALRNDVGRGNEREVCNIILLAFSDRSFGRGGGKPALEALLYLMMMRRQCTRCGIYGVEEDSVS